MRNFKSSLTSIAFGLLALSFSACQEPDLEPDQPGLLVPQTVDQDPSLPQLSVNGTTLHAETFGNQNDPMLIILHGGPGGDYRSMLHCKQFSQHGYFLVFYDQRGSGLSQRHDANTYSIDVMIADLHAIIQHYRQSADQKTFLLGLSWGAMLATAYIDRYPESIAGAILAEPGGFTWPETKEYISRTRESNLLSEESNDVFYFDQILTGKEDEHQILDYKMALTTVHDFADGNALGIAGPTPFWRFGAAVNSSLMEIAEEDGFDFTRNLGQFNPTVLFLYSELNRAYGFNHAQHVSSVYPNAQLMQINDTGHEMVHFGWESFFPLTLNYLNANK
jgi:proline iminopeptidase